MPDMPPPTPLLLGLLFLLGVLRPLWGDLGVYGGQGGACMAALRDEAFKGPDSDSPRTTPRGQGLCSH